jgi:outer membrane receptor protein involved in Fe transport
VALSAAAQHVGRIYLDNTESRDASIAPRTVMNLGAAWRVKPVELSLRVLNALDRKYETGGYMDYDASGALVPHYIPAATRNVLGQVRIDW